MDVSRTWYAFSCKKTHLGRGRDGEKGPSDRGQRGRLPAHTDHRGLAGGACVCVGGAGFTVSPDLA